MFVILLALLPALGPHSAWAQLYAQNPSFDAGNGNASTLSECMVAVGPSDLLVFHQAGGNINVYDKATRALKGSFNSPTLFGAPAGTNDPVCFFDPVNQRFLLACFGGTGDNRIYLAVSHAATFPASATTADWYKYSIVDPAPASHDYTGLGVSSDKIVIHFNGTWANGANSGSRFFVINLANAYTNAFPDPTNITNQLIEISTGGSKPCRNLTSSNTLHVVGFSGTSIVYKTITGTAGSATLSGSLGVIGAISTGFSIDAEQPSTRGLTCAQLDLFTNGALPELTWRNGHLAVAMNAPRDYGDGAPVMRAVRVLQFDTNSNTALQDFMLGQPGMHYTHPSVSEDAQGTLFVGYDRSSATEFASCYMVARSAGGAQSLEYLVQAGVTPYTRIRAGYPTVAAWGDYTGIAVDEFALPSSSTTIYYAGQWAQLSGGGTQLPGVAVGSMTATYGTDPTLIYGTVYADDNGVLIAQSGAPVELTQGGVVKARTVTTASGGYYFNRLLPGTYVLRLAWPSGAAQQAIPGNGGMVLSPSEIQITIAQGQFLLGSQFIVRRAPLPMITTLSHTSVVSNQTNFTLTVTGADFRNYSVIRIDGREQPTTFNAGTGQLSATVTNNDIAHPRNHAITVFTAGAPGSGVCLPATLTSTQELPPWAYSSTLRTQWAACPAEDAGNVGTLVVQAAGLCSSVVPANVRAKLVWTTSLTRFWDATIPNPTFSPYTYELIVNGTYDSGTNRRTFVFDAGKVSGCGVVAFAVTIENAAWPNSVVGKYNFACDIRSFDGDPKVLGTVDRFDQAALGVALNVNDRCWDFNFTNEVDASDAALWGTHSGHYAQTRQILTPNTYVTYDRTPQSHPPIPITWVPGVGDSARVKLNLTNGSTTWNIATNEPDDGTFTWTDYCWAFAGQSYRVEVIHQAGVFTAGDLMFGSDQSDNNFAIQGNCNSGGGGCPFVDVLTEDGWREENSILARSPGGELKPDVYRLTSAPRIESDGSLRIRIREDERERTRLSAARLVVVDRDPDQRAAIVDGRIVLARRVPAWRVRSGSGADVTSVVTLEGGAGYRTAPGELLDVELLPEDPGAGGGEGGTGGTEIGGIVMDGGGKEFENTTPVAGYGDAYDRKLLDATGIVIERPGEKGGWSAGAHLYPRAHFGELASRAGSRVRLRSLGRHDLRAIGWLRVESPEPERAVASLAKAEHTRLGDVKATLASENDELTLETGESLELTFRPGAIPDGKVRDYFLVTHGVYTTLAPGTPAVAAAQPKKLELGAARPNPTSSTVRFSYSLPVRDRVSVDIFDTAGRLIRSLVSETREAGEHEAIWDLQDRAGHRVQGGMYFCRMEVGRWKQQRKVAVTE